MGVNLLTDVAGASVTLAVSNIGAEKNTLVLATASGHNSLSEEAFAPLSESQVPAGEEVRA